jgi:uncharacterized membrane protein (DUF2068 family)
VRVNTVKRSRTLLCNTERMKFSHARLLRLIALFKFLKSASLIALSVGAFRLLHKDLGQLAEHWVERWGLDPGKHYVMVALEKVSRVSPQEIKKLGIVGLIYAALFLTEGIGLWMLRRWGEWVTVIISGSLVPVEIYETYRHPSALKVCVVVVNVAIVIYLIWRIRSQQEYVSGRR